LKGLDYKKNVHKRVEHLKKNNSISGREEKFINLVMSDE